MQPPRPPSLRHPQRQFAQETENLEHGNIPIEPPMHLAPLQLRSSARAGTQEQHPVGPYGPTSEVSPAAAPLAAVTFGDLAPVATTSGQGLASDSSEQGGGSFSLGNSYFGAAARPECKVNLPPGCLAPLPPWGDGHEPEPKPAAPCRPQCQSSRTGPCAL